MTVQIKMDDPMRERSFLYIDRVIKSLEEKVNIDHERLAKDRVAYEVRRKLGEQAEGLANEYDTWVWLHDTLMGV